MKTLKTILTKDNETGGLIIIKSKFNTVFYEDGREVSEFTDGMKNGDVCLVTLKKLSKKEIDKYKIIKAL